MARKQNNKGDLTVFRMADLLPFVLSSEKGYLSFKSIVISFLPSLHYFKCSSIHLFVNNLVWHNMKWLPVPQCLIF